MVQITYNLWQYRARKTYQCDHCGIIIEPKEIYYREKSYSYYIPNTVILCENCGNLYLNNPKLYYEQLGISDSAIDEIKGCILLWIIIFTFPISLPLLFLYDKLKNN